MLPSMLSAPSRFPAGADTFNNQNHRYDYSVNCAILTSSKASEAYVASTAAPLMRQQSPDSWPRCSLHWQPC
jgi:hypothetical protein